VPEYNIEAINEVMRKAQDAKPAFNKISDSFPQLCTDPSAYGTLPSSAAVSQAVDNLNTAMHKEFDAAATKIENVARALDAVVQSLRNQEANAVRTMTPRG
jgi:hypothetical protein